MHASQPHSRWWTRGLISALGLLVITSCADLHDEMPTAPDVDEQVVERPQGPDLAHLQDFGPAIRASERHTPALMAVPGVVGTAVGLNAAGRPAVKIFLAHEQVPGIPTQLDGVPVAVEVTGLFYLRTDRTSRARPAPIGFSVGHPSITAGTLGARVTKENQVFILSNNHVLANSNDANIGDNALQPGSFDGGSNPADAIGTLHDYYEIVFGSGGNNTMDAAIALVDGADVSGSTPADEGYGSPSTNPVDPAVGNHVQKYGRTTGHTLGTVAETNVTVSVCFAGFIFCTKSATFVGQFTITPGDFSQGGDSGSLIVTQDGNHPVGLLFAGSSTRTIANPIKVVLDHFGVAIDPTVPGGGNGNGGDPDPSGPTAIFTFNCTDLSCDFDGSGSTAGDASIASYDWNFGDGNTGSGETVSHSYSLANTYTVTLTVTDADGLDDVDSQQVTVTEDETPGEGDLAIDQFNISTRSTGPWNRADVNWTVSHSGGGLASVTTELFSGTSVLDTQTSSVSGSSASGEHSFRTRTGTPDRVRLTVTDVGGDKLVVEKDISF